MGINTNKEFDQIFQEKLHDYEVMPPESVWAGIEASGLHATAAKSSNWRWWAAASILALFLSTSGYLYLNEDEIEPLNKKQNTTQLHHTIEIITQDGVVNNDDIEKVDESQINFVPNNSEASIKENTEVEDIEYIEQMIFEEEVIAEESFTIVEQDNNTIEYRTENPKKTLSLENQNIVEGTVGSQNIEKQTENPQASKAGRDFFDDDAIDDITSGHLYDKYWVLGLEFSPEWITIPDNSTNIVSYGLDFSAKYHFSKWFVETGLGLAFSKDNGDYKVDYQVGQFKGSYEDVYNVTFDTTGGSPIPTYYTKTVNVYDTVDVYSVQKVENNYAYINIPLNIGYSSQLGNKFTFYAKTGLIASFKIYENIPVPNVSIGGDDVIINPDALEYKIHRTDWHLQAQFNIGLDYHITEKFLFGVEPNARYYIKSLVDDNTGGNPYGIGVKIGFKYILK